MLPIFYLNYLESGRKGISLPFCLIGLTFIILNHYKTDNESYSKRIRKSKKIIAKKNRSSDLKLLNLLCPFQVSFFYIFNTLIIQT